MFFIHLNYYRETKEYIFSCVNSKFNYSIVKFKENITSVEPNVYGNYNPTGCNSLNSFSIIYSSQEKSFILITKCTQNSNLDNFDLSEHFSKTNIDNFITNSILVETTNNLKNLETNSILIETTNFLYNSVTNSFITESTNNLQNSEINSLLIESTNNVQNSQTNSFLIGSTNNLPNSEINTQNLETNSILLKTTNNYLETNSVLIQTANNFQNLEANSILIETSNDLQNSEINSILIKTTNLKKSSTLIIEDEMANNEEDKLLTDFQSSIINQREIIDNNYYIDKDYITNLLNYIYSIKNNNTSIKDEIILNIRNALLNNTLFNSLIIKYIEEKEALILKDNKIIY